MPGSAPLHLCRARAHRPGHPDGLALDGDAALALDVHPVEVLRAGAALVDDPGQLQHPVGQRRLAVVDVGDDAEVADQPRIGVSGQRWLRHVGLSGLECRGRVIVPRRRAGTRFRCCSTVSARAGEGLVSRPGPHLCPPTFPTSRPTRLVGFSAGCSPGRCRAAAAREPRRLLVLDRVVTEDDVTLGVLGAVGGVDAVTLDVELVALLAHLILLVDSGRSGLGECHSAPSPRIGLSAP